MDGLAGELLGLRWREDALLVAVAEDDSMMQRSLGEQARPVFDDRFGPVESPPMYPGTLLRPGALEDRWRWNSGSRVAAVAAIRTQTVAAF
nr:hypothetical protein [Nocardia miyunensis]